MSRFRRTYRRRASGLALVLALALAAACGSGATEGPDDDAGGDDRDRGRPADSATSDGSGTGDGGGTGGDGGSGSGGGGSGSGGGDGGGEYSWGLPEGDLTPDTVGQIFNTLRSGNCAEAESLVGNALELMSDTQERLYRAAIAACSGDSDAAREILGSGGITRHPGDCRLYKAIRSVVDQRSQGSITCPQPAEDPPDSGNTTSSETVGPTTEPTTETTDTTGPTDTTDTTDTSGGSVPGEQDGTG